MIKTLEMSSRRGTLGPRLFGDTVHELIEEVPGIPRAGAGLGVILHAPCPKLGAGDALDRAVVEVAVGQFDAARERIFADGEAVILARYLYASGIEVPYGMVRAVVAEGHLVSF